MRQQIVTRRDLLKAGVAGLAPALLPDSFWQLLATPVTSFTAETEFCAIRNANTVVHGKAMQNGIAGGSPC